MTMTSKVIMTRSKEMITTASIYDNDDKNDRNSAENSFLFTEVKKILQVIS